MPNSITFIALLPTFVIASCAADPVSSSDTPTSSVGQASTTINDPCAVDHAPNASEVISDVIETYTRTATTIDPLPGSNSGTSCGCAAWQVDANANGEVQANIDHPTCRPDTFVNLQWQGLSPLANTILYHVVVPSWRITSQTECNNSTLTVSFWKLLSGTWTQQNSTQISPTWDANQNICNPVEIAGNGAADGFLYRVHALATRGLGTNNHGYETVQVFGEQF